MAVCSSWGADYDLHAPRDQLHIITFIISLSKQYAPCIASIAFEWATAINMHHVAEGERCMLLSVAQYSMPSLLVDLDEMHFTIYIQVMRMKCEIRNISTAMRTGEQIKCAFGEHTMHRYQSQQFNRFCNCVRNQCFRLLRTTSHILICLIFAVETGEKEVSRVDWGRKEVTEHRGNSRSYQVKKNVYVEVISIHIRTFIKGW